MPNDCANDLTITFKTKQDCDNFIKKYITDDEFKFNNVIPEPEDNNNDHDWRYKNWNTGRESYDNIIEVNNNVLNIYFSSAWSPAINVIQQLCLQNPDADIHYTYYECGMQFAGGIDNGIEYTVPPYNQQVWRKWLIEKEYEDQEYFDELDAEEKEYAEDNI